MNLFERLVVITAIRIMRHSVEAAYVDQSFAVEPVNQTAVFGSKIVLPCKINNKTGILQWTMNDFGLGDKRDLPAYDRYRMIGDDKDGNYSLEIFPVTLEDEGKYECQVGFGPQGQNPLRSRVAWLSVIIPTEPPVILQGPDVYAPEFDEVTLDCVSVAGRPPANITWIDDLGNAIIENVSKKIKDLPNGEGSSVTSTLKMFVTRHHNNKVFTCLAENGEKHKTAKVTLNVFYPPKVFVSMKSGSDPSCGIWQEAGITIFRQVYSRSSGQDQEWLIGTQLICGNNNETTKNDVWNKLQKASVDCKTVGEPENPEKSFSRDGPKFVWNVENVESNLKNNVTLECTAEGNPLPETVWIHGSTRQVVSRSSTLSLPINPENNGLYYCKVIIRKLSAVLGSDHPYLISNTAEIGILGTIDRVECSIVPVPAANQVHLKFFDIDVNGTAQQYANLEDRNAEHRKSVWLVRQFESTNVDTQNWSNINFHGFDTDLLKTWIETKRNFPLLMMILGTVLVILAVTTIILLFFLSRRNQKKSSFSYSGRKNHCLSENSSKGSDCKLELVSEADDQSESEFITGKKGFVNEMDVGSIVPVSVGTFRSTAERNIVEPIGTMPYPAGRTSGGYSSNANPASKVNVNENYISYIGYARDYNPPESTFGADNPFVLKSLSAKSSGIDCAHNPYLTALDSLLPENLRKTVPATCEAGWPSGIFGQKARNSGNSSLNSSVCSMPYEMTLL